MQQQRQSWHCTAVEFSMGMTAFNRFHCSSSRVIFTICDARSLLIYRPLAHCSWFWLVLILSRPNACCPWSSLSDKLAYLFKLLNSTGNLEFLMLNFSLENLHVVLMGLHIVASPTSDVGHLPAFIMCHYHQWNFSSNECMPHCLGIFYSCPESEIRSVVHSYLADFGSMTGSGHWRGMLWMHVDCRWFLVGISILGMIKIVFLTTILLFLTIPLEQSTSWYLTAGLSCILNWVASSRILCMMEAEDAMVIILSLSWFSWLPLYLLLSPSDSIGFQMLALPLHHCCCLCLCQFWSLHRSYAFLRFLFCYIESQCWTLSLGLGYCCWWPVGILLCMQDVMPVLVAMLSLLLGMLLYCLLWHQLKVTSMAWLVVNSTIKSNMYLQLPLLEAARWFNNNMGNVNVCALLPCIFSYMPKGVVLVDHTHPEAVCYHLPSMKCVFWSKQSLHLSENGWFCLQNPFGWLVGWLFVHLQHPNKALSMIQCLHLPPPLFFPLFQVESC